MLARLTLLYISARASVGGFAKGSSRPELQLTWADLQGEGIRKYRGVTGVVGEGVRRHEQDASKERGKGD